MPLLDWVRVIVTTIILLACVFLTGQPYASEGVGDPEVVRGPSLLHAPLWNEHR